MTITEFLEARIAEDEREAQKGGEHNAHDVFARDNYGWLLIQPFRVLAECAAKRAIIELHFQEDLHTSTEAEECADCMTIYLLAAVYKDHPDYDGRWAL